MKKRPNEARGQVLSCANPTTVPACRIRSVRKSQPCTSERSVPSSVTLAQAKQYVKRYGLTRLADITGLDRVGIPVFTAVVPKSEDTISVYNGKGVNLLDASTGALMEAVERQVALHAKLPLETASVRDLQGSGLPIALPESFNHKLRKTYSHDSPYLWTTAYDLASDEWVKVPAGLAGFGPQYLRGSPFTLNSSNGMASGNCFEEAVCHSLCELIERDAFTLADLRGQWIPRAIREALFGRVEGADGEDDDSACPIVDLDTAGEPITELRDRFERSGLSPVVRDITSDLEICCALAVACDDSVQGFPQAHCGLGAHPNARIAVARALTELAQSRAADIQGAREDIVAAGTTGRSSERHMQRVKSIDRRRWLMQEAGAFRPFTDLPSVENDDIRDDVKLIINSLEAAGMGRVLVADFGAPAPFSVVRVMVPGLEFWSLEGGAIGSRALDLWKRHTALSPENS
jgi:ribosomal protein S12 methylthiotransferase accessory factor YcaO